MFGRCFRIGLRRGDPEAAMYFIAESDPAKALRILRAELPEDGLCFDDRGVVTQELIDALDLRPGQFHRAWP
jgi:hypothetical protein